MDLFRVGITGAATFFLLFAGAVGGALTFGAKNSFTVNKWELVSDIVAYVDRYRGERERLGWTKNALRRVSCS
jgi:hypothetical protein